VNNVLYMEIDLKNKDLPTGRVGETIKELAAECGRSPLTIRSEMSRAKKEGRPCRFIRVEMEGADDEQD